MGGDIGEIQLGSERELYNKYINHYAVVKQKYSEIILVQVCTLYLHFFRITVIVRS